MLGIREAIREAWPPLRHILTDVLRDLWSWKADVLRAVLACWWIWAIYLAALLGLAGTQAGIDLISAAWDSQGLPFFWFFAAMVVGTVQAYLGASLVLARGTAQQPGVDGRVFAQYFVPFALVILLLVAWPALLPHRSGTEFLRILLGMAVGIPPVIAFGFSSQGQKDASLPEGILITCTLTAGLCILLLPVALAALTLVCIAALAIAVLVRHASIPEPRWRLAAAVIGVAYGAVAIVALSQPIGAAATLLCVLQVWVLVLGLLTAVLKRWTLLVVAGAAVLLYVGRPQDRPVRPLAVNTTAPAAPSVEKYAQAWLAARREEIRKGPYPVFLVAADGGGIRAAYWSATVLGALRDSAPNFHKHVFALSGVSGGALGVAIYGSMPDNLDGLPCATRQRCAQEVLSYDFLAPALAALLTRDVLGGLALGRVAWDDRAVQLERAFERGWRDVMKNDRFAERFNNPSLLLNSTSDIRGERVVIQAGEFRTPLRLSTAVLLSARFPVISPGGMLNGDRLVDGGYADNSGAATAQEVLPVFLKQAAAMGLREHLVPVAIFIGNDEPTPKGECEAPPDEPVQSQFLIEPLFTMNRVRSGLARMYKEQFTKAVLAEGGVVLKSFGLYRCVAANGEEIAIPLTWTLSGASRQYMDGRVELLKTQKTGDFAEVLRMTEPGWLGSK